MHNAALASENLDAVYLPLPVAPTYERFARFMDFISAHPHLGICGLSVTIPHKQSALRWLYEHKHGVSELARRAGAVNTLSRQRDGSWVGDNSDVVGVVAALQAATTDEELKGQTALVLGAGGVARGGGSRTPATRLRCGRLESDRRARRGPRRRIRLSVRAMGIESAARGRT